MLANIRPKDLAEWLAQYPAPLVLDVREPWEVQTACVRPDGFQLVQMPMHTVPARLNELPRQQAIACLCHHGARSAQVAYFLLNQGYENVVNIQGGIHAWTQEVDPSVPQY